MLYIFLIIVSSVFAKLCVSQGSDTTLKKQGCFVTEGLQFGTGYWLSNLHLTVAESRISFISFAVAVRLFDANDFHAVLFVTDEILYTGFLPSRGLSP
jgi:hypothetical protein